MKVSIAFIVFASLLDSSRACFPQLSSRGAPADCSARSFTPDSLTAITNARIFNGNSFGLPQTVVFDNGKIVSVGFGRPPASAKVIDGSGKFLLPGFIDSHVHPGDCAALAELAAYGVTTAINMNCLDYEQCAALKHHAGVADFVTAGLIGVGPASSIALRYSIPYDQTINPSTDLEAHIRYAFNNGSDFYKIAAQDNGPTLDQQKKLVKIIHKYDKMSATHATLAKFYDQAIKSRTDSIQHIATDDLLSPLQRAQIRRQGQFVTPTLEIFRLASTIPALSAAFLGNSTYEVPETNVMNLYKLGVPIAAGTDAVGNVPGLINLPFGTTLHCELENLVNAGFRNVDALKAATTTAAKLHRLHDRGVVAKGMRADLLLLNSNPILDVRNSRDIFAAWAGGARVADIRSSKGEGCKY